MAVSFSKQVINGLEQFKQSLLDYPISKERAVSKVNGMKSALMGVGQNPLLNHICMHRDLGQRFRNGKPIIKCLRRFNYKDESGFQWAFSYIVKDDGVLFVKMLPSRMVIKEQHLIRLIRESIKNVLRDK